MIRKGRITVDIKNGEGEAIPLTFHFGLWVIEKLEMTFNAQLTEMYDTGKKDEKGAPIIGNKFLDAVTRNPYKFSANLLFWGRYFVYELEDKEVDFTLADAYLWIDDLGLNSKEMVKISECFNESLKSHLPAVEDAVKEVSKKKPTGQRKSGHSV